MKNKKLSLFAFFAITASMVMTVYEYPTFATSGFSLVFFLILGGLLWFLPVALCSAELASVDNWSEGGIFTWVKNTLGEKFGFAAIFFQWFQITVGFVTMIYFIIGGLAYVLNFPELNTNPLFKFIAVLIIFWLLTFSQFGGTKYTSKIAKIGFIIGIVFPMLILFGISINYLLSGNPINIEMNIHTFIPDFSKPSTLVVFVSFILAYMGVEASAVHITELKNPKRNYPLAMILLVILAISLNTIGGLTIASVIPLEQLSLNSGVIQAFEYLIKDINPDLLYLVKGITVLIIFGVIAEISSWVVGPSKGMYIAAKNNLLPKQLAQVNKNNVPTNLILLQGIIVTIWAAILTFGGGGNNLSFLIAISLTVVIYLIAYILFFIGYFILIFKKKDLNRTYNVPGGRIGKVIIASCGLITSLFALFISFFPPDSISKSQNLVYLSILIISFIITLLIPFLIYEFYSKKQINK